MLVQMQHGTKSCKVGHRSDTAPWAESNKTLILQRSCQALTMSSSYREPVPLSQHRPRIMKDDSSKAVRTPTPSRVPFSRTPCTYKAKNLGVLHQTDCTTL